MKSSLFHHTAMRTACTHFGLVIITLLALIYPGHAQTPLLRDDFDNAATLDQSNAGRTWTVYGNGISYGTTQFGNQPSIVTESGTTFARLKLSTYNTNSLLKGTEMYSRPFALENGKEFEARVRAPNLASGIVAAFWTYSYQGTYGTSTYKADEIDFEILSKQAPNWLWLTNWNDWNPDLHNYMDGVHNMSWSATIGGFDWSGWNTYKIRWLPDRTEWYINDNLIKSATPAHPNDPMGVRFNIWTPDSGWTDAYDSNLRATTNPAANVDYYLDVDWVEVRPITTATPVPAPAAPGNLVVTAASTSQINLTWTDNSTNESGFKIERSTDGSTFTPLATTGAGTTGYSDTGLSASTTRYYRVYAYNTGGNSAASNTASATTLALIPAAPTGLQATAGNAQVTLSWSAVIGAADYNVKRAAISGGPYTAIASVVTTTGYTDTSVTNGISYFYVVTAVNVSGESADSSQAVATPQLPPAAPTNLTATATSTSQINLTWTDNSTNESGFKIERSSDSTTFSQIATPEAGTISYNDTSVAASTTRYYRIYAYNVGGNSTASNTANATTLTPPPAAPAGLQAIAGNAQVTLSWSAVPGAASYNVKRATVSAGPYTTIAGSVTTTGYTDAGVTNGTTFYYVIAAVNPGGESANSTEVATTPQSPPAAPTNLTATVASASQINLTWTDNSTNESGFKIARSTDGTTFIPLATTNADTLVYSDTGLAASTTFSYRVCASNAGGNSVPTNTASATTLALAPTALQATAGNAQVTLSWSAVAGASGYNVKRATISGGPYTTIAGSVTTTGYIDSSVTNGTTYYYVVAAVNPGGESANSAQVTATPQSPPAAPTNLTATAASTSQINLVWTDNATNENGFKIERSTDGTTFSQIATPGAGTTGYSDTGLAAATTRYYRVYASNTSGNSAPSNTASATTRVSPPAAPTGLTATAGNAQVTLAWSAVTGAASYNVKRATISGGPYTTIAGSVTTTGYIDSSVTNGTTYYYVVAAVTPGGESANSAQVTATPQSPLLAPGSLTAVAVSNSQINLTWLDTSTSETGFKIERSTDNITFIQIATVGAGAVSYANTGLAGSTTYYYRVRAYNAGGNSPYSNTANAKTSPIPTVPGNLTATAASISQTNLKWTDNSLIETGFKIERKTGLTGAYAQIATVGANVTSYNNTGLAASTVYYYRVRAYNTSGNSAYSNEVMATTLTPVATPYGTAPVAIPGVVQVENFDKGGQGVAYSDTTAANQGGYYRTTEGVDIGVCDDTGGGYSIGWSAPGEWLSYAVNVTAAGTYNIALRVASAGSGGTFHIEFNGVNKTGPLTVPNTGGWQTHQTVLKSGVSLAAGPQTMKLVMDSNGPSGAIGNFNSIQITGDTTPPIAAVTSPVVGYSYRTLAQVSGTASDTGGSGLAQVKGKLYRYADNSYWNGSAWVISATELAVTGTTSWTFALPTLSDGRYAFQAVARDGAGNSGNSSNVDFWIDNGAPSVTIYYPKNGVSYDYSVPEANGVAWDTGPGVAQVRGSLSRADGLYWDGRAWVAGVREIAAQISTVDGRTTWKIPFPPLASGTYTFQATARDFVGNTTSTNPVRFSVTATSSSALTARSSGGLSSVVADAATQSVHLDFTTALDSAGAADTTHYSVEVAGQIVRLQGASYNAATQRVTLSLEPGTLQAGSTVVVSWTGLSDASGRPLVDGSWQGSAR